MPIAPASIATASALSGVGPKTAPLFARSRDRNGSQLLDYLPFRYDDFRFPTPARRLGESGGEENAVGRVIGIKERRVRALEIVEVQLVDDERRHVYGEMDRAQSLRLRTFSRRNAAFRAWPSRANLFGRGRKRFALRASRRRQAIPRRAGAGLSRLERSGQPQDRLGHQEESRASDRASAARSVAAVARFERANTDRSWGLSRRPLACIRRKKPQRARERFVFGEFLGLATAAQLRRNERERDHDARALRIPAACSMVSRSRLPFRAYRRTAARHSRSYGTT